MHILALLSSKLLNRYIFELSDRTTTFGAVIVNVNKRSVSVDAHAFILNYLLGVNNVAQSKTIKYCLSSRNSLLLSPPTCLLSKKKNMNV